MVSKPTPGRVPMRTMLAVVLLLSGAGACTTPPAPGPTPPRAASPETASLLRRVAEAADGFRDGIPRYVVASQVHPHNVLGAFLSRAQADDSLASVRASDPARYSSYEVFGPYAAVDDPPMVAADTSEEVLEVVVKYRGGKTTTYRGDEVDAIFWGLPAFDKFIAPYLTAVSGVRYAAEQRELYRVRRSPLVHSTAAAHYRTSF
jgi:hypothetical protein